MKRNILLMALCLVTFFNCSDEIEFNTPAIQGHKNGELWKAQFYAADIDFGGFVIEGGNLGERVQLITTNDVRGTFDLGLESGNAAFYVAADGTVYSTKNTPDTNIFLYPPSGQIIVEDIDNDDPKGIYGTFWFNAFTADGSKVINFNRGVFYNVPLVGGLVQIEPVNN
ncbi:DUF6252 family protein [Yeosuana sp. MJ-SS3]|uniref:DUF6252 family protein n=1 Tax=Gilvirhabdus luticola TaxID=3079858 RepID=A0ABU3U3M1_9FLAO|nr:DUF6252 family protein [Yeosuana sp. MJ-SS3]MDU8884998.1 DUF6252 family protein [Yeosuana sp. MJ-SS3]